MYCGNCGAQIPDNADFCPNCGAKTSASGNDGAAAAESPSRPLTQKEKYIKWGLIGVIVLVVIILCFSFLGGRSYKTVVNKYVKASFEMDGKTIMDLMPDELIEMACEEEDMTKKELEQELNNELESSMGSITRYYDDFDYSFEIMEVEDFSKEELADLNEEYQEDSGIDIKIKAAKTATVELTFTLDEDNEYTNEMEIGLIKVGKSWYLDFTNMSF